MCLTKQSFTLSKIRLKDCHACARMISGVETAKRGSIRTLRPLFSRKDAIIASFFFAPNTPHEANLVIESLHDLPVHGEDREGSQ